ncbi:hypothetical protein [Leptospira noguchii]|uniref:hypothetical protein n=1 Tax=Leptospira noguchii TaxID=28182 RepID=UPI0003286EBC|nr:hypothetical protein [Leptospira noguchii]EMS84716.1 hypothetical protein LEP1GSC073_1776 [Leptospira noguchii str. Cascata]
MNDKIEKSIKEVYDEAIEIIDESRKYLPFSRDIEFQKESLKKLREQISWIKSAKAIYAGALDETNANNYLYLQSCAYALISMLEVVIFTKEKSYHSAWDSIINAEEYIALGLRVAPEPEFLEELSRHRQMMEKVFLPDIPFYNSMGAYMKGGKCSICRSNYGNCEHIDGLIYYGSMCKIIDITDLKINHSAIVTNPRDRRCIPLHFESKKGFMRDIFTWIETEDIDGSKTDTEHNGMKLGFVYFNNKRIDSD